MPVGIHSFNSERLVQARIARGLTAVNLADIADISPSSISLYEKGTQKPRQEVIERLARSLNVPVRFFFKDLPPQRPDRLYYRSMSAATKAARNRAQSQYEWATEVLEYLLNFFDFPDFHLPELDIPNNFRDLTAPQIEMIAQQVRESWNLGMGPISNMIRTLESNGIIVWRMSLESNELDAFSEFRLPHPLVILSSDKDNYFRSRFDAAHELGHIILHSKIDKSSLGRTDDFKEIENQAHLFAGAFLLPATTYCNEVPSPSLDTFRSLKTRWDVSISMQIMRCRQLGLTTRDEEKRLWINLSRRKWKSREPLDDSTPVEQPTLIRRCIELLTKENVRSIDQIIDELNFSPQDLEKLCSVPHGFFRTTESNSDEPEPRISSNVVPFRR